MNLKFKGGSELVLLQIDRANKKLQVATSRTGYKLKPAPWKYLFDKGKERVQENITDKLDDKQFKQTIIMSMMQKGYLLIKND